MFAQGSSKKEWPPTTRGHGTFWENTDGLERDCNGSSELAMELLQSCAQPLSLSTSDRGPVGGVGMGDIGIEKRLSAETIVGPMNH